MNHTFTYEDLSALMDQAIERIESFKNVPDDLFLLKPDPGSWSADEICQHLIQFNKLYLNQIEKASGNSDLPVKNGNAFKPGLVSRVLIKVFEPPYKVKLNTLAPMYPFDTENKQPKMVLDQLIETDIEFKNRIETFRNKKADLDRIKGTNPIARFLPMSITDYITVLDAHQRRHFWQIEKTLYKLSGEKY